MVMDIDECNNINLSTQVNKNTSTCFIQNVKCHYNNTPLFAAFTTKGTLLTLLKWESVPFPLHGLAGFDWKSKVPPQKRGRR